MRPDADLSLRGHARLVAELIERLELRDVTLVQSDIGVAQVVAVERPDVVDRLVLTSEEAFDNYPPGLAGKAIGILGKLPGGVNVAVQQLRVRPLRRLPLTFGWMSKRPVANEVMDRWLRPAQTSREIRRDLVKYLRSVDKRAFVDIASRLQAFDKPALVVWAAEDRMMPSEHGRRLAELLPQGRLEEIADSYTLIPEDQPQELARLIREFVQETAPVEDPASAR